MTLSHRERSMLVLTVLVALYGITGILARGRIELRRAALEELEKAGMQRDMRQALIGQHDRWRRQYAQLRDLMPVFDAGRQVETHWLGLMDRAAARHGLNILRRQVGAEISLGEVYEMPIDCREWEGTLDSLLRFLYDLQSEGVMLDVRQLFIRPREAGNPGMLRGRFVLYCAYLRNRPDEAGQARADQE